MPLVLEIYFAICYCWGEVTEHENFDTDLRMKPFLSLSFNRSA